MEKIYWAAILSNEINENIDEQYSTRKRKCNAKNSKTHKTKEEPRTNIGYHKRKHHSIINSKYWSRSTPTKRVRDSAI